jgi:hypothetical protein
VAESSERASLQSSSGEMEIATGMMAGADCYLL